MENADYRGAARIERILDSTRAVLVRGIGDLDTAGFDWRILPNSTSIGQNVLHLVAFEFLLVSAVELDQGKEPDNALWTDLKHGFERRGEFHRKTGFSPAVYRQVLETVRNRLKALLPTLRDGLWVDRSRFHLEDVVDRLDRLNACDGADKYQRMLQGVLSTLGAAKDEDEIDLPNTIMEHEAYHRGQILYLRYLREQFDQAVPPAMLPS